MKVNVVDNGGQWTHREWRMLKYLKVETEIIPNTTPFEEIDVDALLLSGGAPRISRELLKLGLTSEYLEKADFPILGICVGLQYIILHYGGRAGVAEIPEYGKTEIVIDKEDDLFQGLPKRFQVWESHNDEIKEVPKCFEVLAHSNNCQYQAVKYKKKPFYGVQFHPEVEHTDYGKEIFESFLKVAKS